MRASELQSLTRGSLVVHGDNPCVTVQAAFSKRRREDVLPLRQGTAAELREFLGKKLPNAPVFGLRRVDALAKGLAADLAVARKVWLDEACDADERQRRDQSDHLRYRDSAGRYADFHSLRVAFVTNVVAGGADAKTAQTLARHSTPVLTMNVYARTLRGSEAKALANMPDFSPTESSRQRATGTYAPGNAGTDYLCAAGRFSVGNGAGSVKSGGLLLASSGSQRGAFEPANTGHSAAKHGDSANGPGRTRTCDQGIMSPQL